MKIFLHTVLRDIPYLKDCDDELISSLAASMKIDFLEPGAIIYKPGDTQEAMMIIQHGHVVLQTELDNSCVTLENLSRGAILGAYTFLVADLNMVSAVCKTPVYIITMERKRFTELVYPNKTLLKRLLEIQEDLLTTATNQMVLDFINIRHEIEIPRKKKKLVG